MSDYTRANLKPPLTLFKNRHCFSWNCYRWPMSATFVRTIQASVCLWSPQWTWKGAIVWGKRFSENFIKYKLCFGQADLLCSPVRRGISREQVFWVFLRINRKTNITLHTHSKAAQKPQVSIFVYLISSSGLLFSARLCSHLLHRLVYSSALLQIGSALHGRVATGMFVMSVWSEGW